MMMSSDKFIGRGEILTKKVLLRLINCIGIQGQVNLKHIILPEAFEVLDPEIQKHNFDLVLRRTHGKDLVIEVNYKHKEKAARKSRQIFEPLCISAGYEYVTIDDYDCRKRGIFWLNTAKKHLVITWDDFRDIIDSLEKAGVNPAIEIE